MAQYGTTDFDILNLCGGIPSADITNIHVDIQPCYGSAVAVTVRCDQYEVVRTMDFDFGLIDNQFMVVREADRGKHIGTHLFLNQRRAARQFHFPRLRTIARAPDSSDENDETDWYGYVFWANIGYENREPAEFTLGNALAKTRANFD